MIDTVRELAHKLGMVVEAMTIKPDNTTCPVRQVTQSFLVGANHGDSTAGTGPDF